MNRPRVVFGHYDLPTDVGGVSTWIQALVPDLIQRGLDVRVHILNGADAPGPNIRHFQALGVPTRWARASPTLLEGVRQCVAWINQDQPDIYVPNSILPAAYAGAYAGRFGLRTVGVLHSDDAYFSGIIEDFIAKDSVGRLTEVVAVSEFLRSRVESLGIQDLPCHQIPCGVPIPATTTAYNPERFRIAYLGRLSEEQKQISKVTRAICEAAKRHPKLEAVIIGDGPARSAAEKIVAEHPNGNRVHLTGRLNNQEVFGILQDVQALVLLSDYEGLPVSLLEAMATGVVPVCLRMRSGIRELLVSGENGIVVEDREEDFQRAITHLMRDQDLWLHCSSRARKTVVDAFSMSRCHEKWHSVLCNLGKAGGAAIKYPIPVPQKIPSPHRLFGWHEPNAVDSFLSSLSRTRDRLGKWRRQTVSRWNGSRR